ncbi:MAG TPA: hypothetical protein VGO70_08380 [Arsenicitalea sp.]|jgi:hypothetical protein|nr:hypothetical protein [Arsenicitalea sp.]
MALCKFKRTSPPGATIYVNPAQIVAVYAHTSTETWIVTTASDENTHYVSVMETPDQVNDTVRQLMR